MSEHMNALDIAALFTGRVVLVIAALWTVSRIVFIPIPAAFRWLLAEAYAAFGDRERKRAIREHQRRVAKEAK